MKLMKKFKSSIIGLGLVIPVASVASIVTSCGKKEAPPVKTTFDAFTKAAKGENPYKIVQQTKPSPDWVALDAGDLSPGTFNVVGQTVVVSISSKTMSQTAVFVATYVQDTAYNIDAWTCPDGPKDTVTWDVFLTQVKKGGPQAVLDAIKIANPKGINIDLGSIESTSFSVDTKMSRFTYESGISVSLALSLKPNDNLPFLVYKTINIKINFNNSPYDAKNWIAAADYTFDDFTREATASVATDAWKNFAVNAIDSLNWNVVDCEFKPIVVNKETKTLSVTINNNKESIAKKVTVILEFHQKDNKVWIYGEQMGIPKSDGVWKFGGQEPINSIWSDKAKDYINKIINVKDQRDKNLFLKNVFKHSYPKSNKNPKWDDVPNLRDFLNNNKNKPLDPTNNTWDKLRVVVYNFEYFPVNDPITHYNYYGSEEFKMIFYHSNTSLKKPMTTFGWFYINRASATSIPSNYDNCGCYEDITVIK